MLVDKLHQLSIACGPQRGIIQVVGRLRLLPTEQQPLLGVEDFIRAFAAGRVLTAGLPYAAGEVHCAIAALSALDKILIHAQPCALSSFADRHPWHAQPLRKGARAQHREQNHVRAVRQRGAFGAPRLRVSALGCQGAVEFRHHLRILDYIPRSSHRLCICLAVDARLPTVRCGLCARVLQRGVAPLHQARRCWSGPGAAVRRVSASKRGGVP